MCNGLFKGQDIDDTPNNKTEEDELEDEDGIKNLKINTIPKGMVELNFIFNQDESTHSRRNVEEKGDKECDLYNLGTKGDLKMVIIGKSCNFEE